MLLACSPENYTQPNMNTDQAESGWQGTSGWPTVDMYDVQQPWYSETVQPVQPNYAHAAPEPLFQQPGFQVDPAEQLAMGISRVLWPGSSTGDSWQGPGSSWYTAPPVPSAPPNLRGATHFDASSRIAGVMSTAPVPGQMRCLALQEPFDENMSKQELVDEDFERDVTKPSTPSWRVGTLMRMTMRRVLEVFHLCPTGSLKECMLQRFQMFQVFHGRGLTSSPCWTRT